MPTGLFCCPLSIANCHSASPFANSLLWVPSSNSLSHSLTHFPSRRRSWAQAFVSFRAKTDKGNVCLVNPFIVSHYLTHSWEDKGVHTFPKGIFPKVNVIARLEYELTYYGSALHRFKNYTTTTPHHEKNERWRIFCELWSVKTSLWQLSLSKANIFKRQNWANKYLKIEFPKITFTDE